MVSALLQILRKPGKDLDLLTACGPSRHAKNCHFVFAAYEIAAQLEFLLLMPLGTTAIEGELVKVTAMQATLWRKT